MAQLKEDAPDSLAVIYMDLNGLKEVNDTKGHAQEDLLIQTAAKNIQLALGRDTYRIGGDEFVALLTGLTQKQLQIELELL